MNVELFQQIKYGQALFIHEESDSIAIGDTLNLQTTTETLTVRVSSIVPIVVADPPVTIRILGLEHPAHTALRQELMDTFWDKEQKGFPDYVGEEGEEWANNDMWLHCKGTLLTSLLQFCNKIPEVVKAKGTCVDCFYADFTLPGYHYMDDDSKFCKKCRPPKMTKFKKRTPPSQEMIRRCIADIVSELETPMEVDYLLDTMIEHEPRVAPVDLKYCILWALGEGKIIQQYDYTLKAYKPDVSKQQQKEVQRAILAWVGARGVFPLAPMADAIRLDVSEGLSHPHLVRYLCGELLESLQLVYSSDNEVALKDMPAPTRPVRTAQQNAALQTAIARYIKKNKETATIADTIMTVKDLYAAEADSLEAVRHVLWDMLLTRHTTSGDMRPQMVYNTLHKNGEVRHF